MFAITLTPIFGVLYLECSNWSALFGVSLGVLYLECLFVCVLIWSAFLSVFGVHAMCMEQRKLRGHTE